MLFTPQIENTLQKQAMGHFVVIFNVYVPVIILSYHNKSHPQKDFDNLFKQSRKIDLSQVQPRKVEKNNPAP